MLNLIRNEKILKKLTKKRPKKSPSVRLTKKLKRYLTGLQVIHDSFEYLLAYLGTQDE